MNDAPINSFFAAMQSFHPHDVAVLFGLVAMQEVSGDLISPSVERRLWTVELGEEELKQSIQRLESAGEVERVLCPDFSDHGGGDMVTAGFRVSNFGHLQNLMTDFGRRRYYRIKNKECRQRSNQGAS